MEYDKFLADIFDYETKTNAEDFIGGIVYEFGDGQDESPASLRYGNDIKSNSQHHMSPLQSHV